MGGRRGVDVQVPTLVVDEARCRRNLERMAARARRSEVRLRPHFKTHQSLAVGAWFREAGVTEATVSSTAQARYFAAGGWRDLVLAFPANPLEAATLSDLAGRVRLGLLFASADGARAVGDRLAARAEAWLEVDVGMGRTGVPWDRPEELLAVARAVRRYRRLALRGLLTHAGHVYGARSVEEIRAIHRDQVLRMQSARAALEALGVGGLELSVGDTPSCSLVEDLSGVDEVRPGNFVYYDLQQVRLGSCREEDVAAALVCPVVASCPERGEVAVHGGAVHLSKDTVLDDEGRPCYGRPASWGGDGWGKTWPGAAVARVSQEHGILRVGTARARRLRPGDLVALLPAHSCLAAEAMRGAVTVEGRRLDHVAGAPGAPQAE